MLNYDSVSAEAIALPVRRCDPSYGIQGPLYRPTGPSLADDNDDDDEVVGGVSDETAPGSFTGTDAKTAEPSTRQRKSKLRNTGSNGYSELMTLVWWIGIQILCVIGAIIYFVV